jgi:uncharacterized HAD superfamily protein
MLVFCDLDNTLANNDARWAKYKETGDLNDIHSMEAVMTDKLIWQTCETIESLNNNNNMIVILTARHEFDREVTEAWLKKTEIHYSDLILAHDDDERPAKDFKLWEIDNHKWLKDYGAILVLEDNPEIVQHLREHGYTVFQVK